MKAASSNTLSKQPHKEIVLLGLDHNAAFEFELSSMRNRRCHIVSNRKNPISKEELKQLQGMLEKDTRIYIFGHGYVKEGKHHIELLEYTEDTETALLSVDSLTEVPVQIYLNSCHSGAANSVIEKLKVSSTLVTSSAAEEVSYQSAFAQQTPPPEGKTPILLARSKFKSKAVNVLAKGMQSTLGEHTQHLLSSRGKEGWPGRIGAI